MYRQAHNVFLYHAHALALGGWVRDKNGQYTALPALAPSVLSITGGFCSASEKNVNFRIPGRFVFGEEGPKEFHLYVGHAYTEVRGVESENDDALGMYTTTVRSVLDNVFFNDDFYIEHAEAILSSKHLKPGENDDDPPEPKIKIGRSNIANVHVKGAPVTLTPHRHNVDEEPTYKGLQRRLADHENTVALAGKGGDNGDELISDLFDWSNPDATNVKEAPKYVGDFAKINQRAKSHVRYSLFKSVSMPPGTPDVTTFNSSIEVKNFGRIFLGEAMVSYGTKQLTMFRIDLGCDNCGDVGGSGGTTNGSTYPP